MLKERLLCFFNKMENNSQNYIQIFEQEQNKEDFMNKNYILIDSSGILHSQYFGLKNDKVNNYEHEINGKKVNLSGIIGYFKVLKKIKKEFEGEIIHILDAGGGSDYRKQIYPEYKSHRPEKEADLDFQQKILGFFIRAYGEDFIQMKGVESDDVIGTLSREISERGDFALIVSFDKDLFQLLNDNVFLTREEKRDGAKVFALYDKDFIFKEYGFSPETMVDFLAFVGDKADNIPGVNGIGPEKAKPLLKEFLNVEGVLANLDKIKPAIREKIETQKDNLIVSKKLALIKKDLKVEKINDSLPETLKQNLIKILEKYEIMDM